jgi:hypothetical protein
MLLLHLLVLLLALLQSHFCHLAIFVCILTHVIPVILCIFLSA